MPVGILLATAVAVLMPNWYCLLQVTIFVLNLMVCSIRNGKFSITHCKKFGTTVIRIVIELNEMDSCVSQSQRLARDLHMNPSELPITRIRFLDI